MLEEAHRPHPGPEVTLTHNSAPSLLGECRNCSCRGRWQPHKRGTQGPQPHPKRGKHLKPKNRPLGIRPTHREAEKDSTRRFLKPQWVVRAPMGKGAPTESPSSLQLQNTQPTNSTVRGKQTARLTRPHQHKQVWRASQAPCGSSHTTD